MSIAIGIVIGAVVGFANYKFIGCATGTWLKGQLSTLHTLSLSRWSFACSSTSFFAYRSTRFTTCPTPL